MKIDPIKVASLYEATANNNIINNNSNMQKDVQHSNDRVEISDVGSKHSEIALFKARVINDIEKGASAEKIQVLKSGIENGTYHVSGVDIAEAMIRGHISKS